jgi:hypothetical protein
VTDPALRLLRGGDRDQVKRKLEFAAAHPEVEIMPLGAGMWQGWVPDRKGGGRVMVRPGLRFVLDDLDELFGAAGKAPEAGGILPGPPGDAAGTVPGVS